jgi:hypothetical protein
MDWSATASCRGLRVHGLAVAENLQNQLKQDRVAKRNTVDERALRVARRRWKRVPYDLEESKITPLIKAQSIRRSGRSTNEQALAPTIATGLGGGIDQAPADTAALVSHGDRKASDLEFANGLALDNLDMTAHYIARARGQDQPVVNPSRNLRDRIIGELKQRQK